jgi:HK97 family phage prohead protease
MKIEIPKGTVRCTAPATMSVQDRSKMQVGAVISTEELNRNGHRVMQDGWDFGDYLKNPIVLFGHDDSRPAVGKNVGLTIDGGLLKAVTEFAPTEFGKELFELYAGGYMRAWSVGFQPTVTEYQKDGQGNITEIVFRKQKLIEYSAVPIPANADAVSMALRDKVISDSTFRLLNYTYEETPEACPPEVDGSLAPLVNPLVKLGLMLGEGLIRKPTE